ncbi:unnamed protein product [Gordionus sp. m RMFG-2023]
MISLKDAIYPDNSNYGPNLNERIRMYARHLGSLIYRVVEEIFLNLNKKRKFVVGNEMHSKSVKKDMEDFLVDPELHMNRVRRDIGVSLGGPEIHSKRVKRDAGFTDNYNPNGDKSLERVSEELIPTKSSFQQNIPQGQESYVPPQTLSRDPFPWIDERKKREETKKAEETMDLEERKKQSDWGVQCMLKKIQAIRRSIKLDDEKFVREMQKTNKRYQKIYESFIKKPRMVKNFAKDKDVPPIGQGKLPKNDILKDTEIDSFNNQIISDTKKETAEDIDNLEEDHNSPIQEDTFII